MASTKRGQNTDDSDLTRVKITDGRVAKALADIGKTERTLSDLLAQGLSLRVRAKTAIWCFKGRIGPKQVTRRIGDARVMNVEKAREAALEAWKLVRRGVDPEDRLRELELDGQVVRHFDPTRDGWTWEQGRQAYLAEVQQTKAPDTYRTTALR